MQRSLVLFTLLVGLFLLLTPKVQAKIITSEGSVTIAQDEIIDDDVFITGESVTIEGVVNGDVYAAGGNIIINGTINGDVSAAGGTIDISGKIKDDLRVAGGTVSVKNATIGDSLLAAGGNVIIDKNSKIGGGFIFGAGNMQIATGVGRGILGGGGSVTIDGPVGKDTYVAADKLTLGAQASVAGNLIYSAENQINRASTATIAGTIRQVMPDESKIAERIQSAQSNHQVANVFNFGLTFWSYLSALVVGGVALYLFTKPSQEVVNIIQKNWLATLGWGLVILTVTLPALILLAFTGIGLPLAMILGMLFILELYVSKLVAGVFIGKQLEVNFKLQMNLYTSFCLGLAIYYIASLIPLVGGFVKLVTLLLGLGALFIYVREQLLKMRSK